MSTSSAQQAPWGRAAAALIVFVVVGLFLQHAREQVDLQLEADAGEWRLAEDLFPDWVPNHLTPALQDLQNIPMRVPHGSVHWRDYLKEQLLENPWVTAVENIQRRDGQIFFTAYLLRPVAGIRCQDGHLLITPAGKVVDYVSGEFLDASLAIPEYSTSAGLDQIDPSWSALPEREEWNQLLTLLGDLHDHGILTGHPGFILELQWIPGENGGFWYLLCEGGLRLAWGKTVQSGSRLPGSVADKIQALRQVIADKDLIIPLASSFEEISLYVGPTPIYTER